MEAQLPIRGRVEEEVKVPVPMQLPDEERINKWGYIIYRCTYKDDATWTEFMNVFEEMASVHEGDPRVNSRLWFDVVDDKDLLEHAPIDKICSHFRSWVAEDEEKAGIREKYVYHPEVRYQHFIHVDELALQSVLAEKDSWRGDDWSYGGWVNVVFAAWQHEDEEFRNWNSHFVARVSPPCLYPDYYLYAGGDAKHKYPEPPLVWCGDAEGYWPERPLPCESAFQRPDDFGDLIALQDEWYDQGGLEWYLKELEAAGKSIF